ncbi:MAG: 1-deoxy-D-xylulose-5-phosphate synthase, partial [Chloroflexi bacterium]|nr:1-deoxy-D-xylulose-5-phosphate synthase [Chloroflexota bacterium]
MLLENVNSPADLKRLSIDELKILAEEIRQSLLDTVTRTGGHLASNLGAVELTLALHTVFDTPRDKIVWDVGHQSYVHKVLTGRRRQFDTLRQYGGMSGFPCPDESPHDAFGAGHASTSISAALGLAVARDLKGEDSHIIAVIGDGAMTGGLAYEGLNNAGQIATRLIVLLNDNGMSISSNVGAIAKHLNRLRSDPRYSRAKKRFELVVRSLPLGEFVLEGVRRVKNGLKGLVMPTLLWEQLGFTYLGPIDGHDLRLLQETLRQAKTFDDPTVVHVVTKKGKGYYPAEEDAVSFHGVAPNGTKKAAAPSYTKVFSDTLIRLARANPHVVAITAAMPDGTGLVPFAKEFPNRFFDVGIAEEHAVTFAAGLARQGIRPVVAIYSTFLQRAYDQVVHDVCMQNLPVVFAIDRAGIVGDDGRTHQGAFDIAFLRHIPEMVVMAPRDENELQHMLATALEHNGPVAIRYPRGSGVGVPLDGRLTPIPIGRAEV